MRRDLPAALRRAAVPLVLVVLALVVSVPANADLETLCKIVAGILLVLTVLIVLGTLYGRDEESTPS